MAYVLNPFTGQLDVGAPPSGAPSWTSTCATEAALPLTGNSDGDVKITLDTDYAWVWSDALSCWVNLGVKAGLSGSTPNTSGYSLSTSNVGSNRKELQLILQPADATHSGSMSTGSQTFAGTKTFSGQVYADTGVDTSTASILNLGTGNASTINIGKSGSTINIIGTTQYEQVTNLQVADKLVTINKGSGSSTGFGSGLEIEENSAITGYAKTSSDRANWELKAPGQAGVAVLNAGSSGITLDQSSHNPVTIGAFGSTPNSNGLSVSTQAINLQPADGTNPGAVSTSTQTFAGAKTFSSAPVLSSLTASLPLLLDGSKNITSGAVNLSGAQVTGVLSLANGGTNANLTAANGAIPYSSASAISLLAPGTSGQHFISGGAAAPTWGLYENMAGSMNLWLSPTATGSAGLTSGHDNLSIGASAGIALTSGNKCVFIGANSGIFVTTANSITSIGYSAGSNVTGNNNTFYGATAGLGTSSGIQNTYVGAVAGPQGTSASSNNTGVGYGALNALGSGAQNVGVGPQTFNAYTTQSNGVAVGYQAGFISTGSQCTFLGSLADTSSAAFTNSTAIGYNSKVGASNVVVLGSGGVNVGIDTVTAPTARLHIPAGTATAGTAPLKFTSGTHLTTPADGAMEYNGSNLFFTVGSNRLTLTGSTGDIPETSFTAADNQASAADVTGCAFSNSIVRSFEAIVSVVRGATYAQYTLNAIQGAASWTLAQDYIGDTTGLVFSITTAGQVQYTSTSTGSTATLKFRAKTTSV